MSSLASHAYIKTIILYQHGGLGNQFFQYHHARKIAPNALIICNGYQDLFSCIATNTLSNVEAAKIRIIKSLCARLSLSNLRNAAKNKQLLGYIHEAISGSQLSVEIQPGMLSSVYLQEGFFQDGTMYSSASTKECPLQSDLVSAARQWVRKHIGSRNANPYFLHLRRGDYTHWPTTKNPAVLPCSWYNRQIRKIVNADPKAHFVVFSNDIPYAHEFFGGRSRFTIYQSSLAQEFVLMSECYAGGILSASSLSWWAACYGRQFSPNARYIAPEYWAGWRKSQWYPSTIKTPWLQYENIT